MAFNFLSAALGFSFELNLTLLYCFYTKWQNRIFVVPTLHCNEMYIIQFPTIVWSVNVKLAQIPKQVFNIFNSKGSCYLSNQIWKDSNSPLFRNFKLNSFFSSFSFLLWAFMVINAQMCNYCLKCKDGGMTN